jgi:aryl-alcohol dehydrogenase-like predicted oxidoreductase
MINRRDFLGITAGAGAALTLTPELLFARQSGSKLSQRAIPSSGEMVPVISFSPRAEADNPTMKEILNTVLDNGGRVVDVLHGGPAGENAARTAAAELGIMDKFFWTTPVANVQQPKPGSGPPQPGSGPPPMLDAAAVRAQVEEKMARFKVAKIDLAMASAAADPTHFAVLREMKKEGRIRYIGAHWLLFPPSAPVSPFGNLEAVIRNEQIDFIGTDYTVGDRRLEEKIMPLALERKVGVLAYFPFDRGRLFQRASKTPLPEWAAEFDAKTWAQFFLKYVLSHPAVVMARTGTTKPAHMLENMNAGMGRLPNEAMRKRMAQFVDSLPPTAPPGPQQPPPGPTVTLSAAVLDRYVGEYASAVGFVAIFRREGDKLIVKPGNNPEAALIARSETRFQDPRGPFFEFELDGQGKVLRAFLDQQTPKGVQRIVLERK